MKRTALSFKQKMRPEMKAEVKEDRRGRGLMLIPTPTLVAEEVRKVPRGRLITMGQLRDRLAARFAAHFCCPLTTGIFLNIVAGAAEEDLLAGRRRVTPYWRVVRDNGALSEKLPAGVARQAGLLKSEGHTVVPGRGKAPPRVRDFEQRLVR